MSQLVFSSRPTLGGSSTSTSFIRCHGTLLPGAFSSFIQSLTMLWIEGLSSGIFQMMARMFSMIHQLQVLRPIILAIPIAVMHKLTRYERPTKHLLHNQSVFRRIVFGSGKMMPWRINHYIIVPTAHISSTCPKGMIGSFKMDIMWWWLMIQRMTSQTGIWISREVAFGTQCLALDYICGITTSALTNANRDFFGLRNISSSHVD